MRRCPSSVITRSLSSTAFRLPSARAARSIGEDVRRLSSLGRCRLQLPGCPQHVPSDLCEDARRVLQRLFASQLDGRRVGPVEGQRLAPVEPLQTQVIGVRVPEVGVPRRVALQVPTYHLQQRCNVCEKDCVTPELVYWWAEAGGRCINSIGLVRRGTILKGAPTPELTDMHR